MSDPAETASLERMPSWTVLQLLWAQQTWPEYC